MVLVRVAVVAGRVGMFVANSVGVGFVDAVAVFGTGAHSVGLVFWTDGAAVVIVTGDVGFAGVIDGHWILGTV